MALTADDDAIRITMRQSADRIEFDAGLTPAQLEQAELALPARLRSIARRIEQGAWDFDAGFNEIVVTP